ncbi:putative olfactory receptor 2B8 [Tachyglossus aculeatus]|uniref:putative olfactory receptor 2B8 n=1 Tax=Tachyglossus aculeatus TaxID=9261 RepID=UPI0018F64453|nr:putative olfactory receptor 2B8 [Tachyglossus aculeatus]
MRMMPNDTSGEDFVVVNFFAQPQLWKILFVVILIFYLLTPVGNPAVILVTRPDLHLHKPMYFFLSHLSFLDYCFTTGIVPQRLWNLPELSKTITVVGCAVQLYISLALGSTTCNLLAVMAICRPLHYTTVMHSQLYWMPTMLKLSCVDVRANEIQLFVGTDVLRIKLSRVWRKALGTCGSHLLVVTFFYWSTTVIYTWTNSSFIGTLDNFLTLFCTVYWNFHLSSELTKQLENKEDISASVPCSILS